MPVAKFQAQLSSAFPRETWAPLVQGLRDGVALADRVIEETPLLASVIGRDIRGFIRRAGVLHQISRLCAERVLPFDAWPERMPVGSWHWLNISAGRITVHIVRTDSLRSLPVDAPSRQPEVLKNEFDLFEDGRIPPMEPKADDHERYAVVTFGLDKAGKLTHAAAGMPNYEVSGWLAFLDLTKGAADRGEGFETPIAPVPSDPTAQLKFLKEVQEMLADRDRGEHEKTG